jgi:hypothetical protein
MIHVLDADDTLQFDWYCAAEHAGSGGTVSRPKGRRKSRGQRNGQAHLQQRFFPPDWNAETYTQFVLALAVEAVERGKGVAGGEVLYLHCFQRTRGGLLFMMPGMKGHTRIPKEGDRVRAFLNLRRFDQIGSPLRRKEGGGALPAAQEGTGYEVVYPSGLDWLDRTLNADVFAREAPSRAVALDYWWLFLLGIAAGAAGGRLVNRYRAQKKARAERANVAG